MKPVIRVENLGKKFILGERETVAPTLREAFKNSLKSRALSFINGSGARRASVWALKEVSFEIQPGEVVGIIGDNGAGKSTLLKILARITRPTTGSADLYGRTGTLLGVGTGFHPDLTGRENIYLNGAILGMNRNEITRKFDEIVAFAQVENFLDTPAKRYSSGMYLRLGFAIAAHLEPDILLLDEVLTIADASFQKRCLQKMKDASIAGTTVLFVSHNLNSVRRLCDRAIHIHAGQLQDEGPPENVIAAYLKDLGPTSVGDDYAVSQTQTGVGANANVAFGPNGLP
jgi:lipopolysaccharide transport system ATP-binding protein